MRISPPVAKEMDVVDPTSTRPSDKFRHYKRESPASGTSPEETEGSISGESIGGTSSGNTLNSVNGSVLGNNVPEKNKVVLERIRVGLDTRTTIMIKNVPNKYTQVFPLVTERLEADGSKCLWSTLISQMLELMTSCIFALISRIDASYSPFPCSAHQVRLIMRSVGYAFINFIDPTSIIPFAKARVGTKWSSILSFEVDR